MNPRVRDACLHRLALGGGLVLALAATLVQSEPPRADPLSTEQKQQTAAAALEFLASLHEQLEDFAAALKVRRQVVDNQTKLLGGGHWRVTDARLALADTERLARLQPEQRRQLAEAGRLNRKTLQLNGQGQFGPAVAVAQKVLALYKQVLGEQHPQYATSLNNLAALYDSMGDYARAEPLYRQALAIRKKALGEQHPLYAHSLNNVAFLHHELGDHARAEPLYRQALAIYKQAWGEQHSEYALSLNNLAGLYNSMGDHARAEPLLRQALAIWKKALGEQHPHYAESLTNLAEVYRAQEDFARAESLYRQALAIRKKAQGEQHPDYALGLINLSAVYWAQGHYARAEPLCRQALAIWKKALGGQHPHYATSLNNLAMLYWTQGDYARAETLLKQGLGIERRNLELAADAQSERQQLVMAEDLRATLDAYLSLARQARLPGAAAYAPMLAWKGAVFARQRRIRTLRLLHRNKDPQLARLSGDLQSAAGRLAALAFTVPDPKTRAAWQRQLEELSERKEQLEKELARRSAAFHTQLRRQELTPARLQAALPRDAALIDFLEYTHFRPTPKGKGPLEREIHLAAFVVRRTHPVRQLDLGPVKPIVAAIDRWRGTLQRSRPRRGARDPADQLRQRVWEPLARYLDGVKTVLVSPDGALTRLPFAALPGKDPEHYLIEEVALAVVPVPQLLPELLAPSGRANGGQEPPPALLALGDVDYDADPGRPKADDTARPAARSRGGALLEWRPLEETGDEVTLVVKAFRRRFRQGRVRELNGAEATEQALRRLAPGHRYLHLATHGFFAPEALRSALARNPQGTRQGAELGLFTRHGVSGFHPGLLSGLVLAGANRPPQPNHDDGILTALEVAELDLAGVELAVLSACETGLGEVAGGEGLLGLQRAFQVAGARSVVASLWKVGDRASRELLVRFYKNLWHRNLTRLEALREAQRWMLREGVPRGLVLVESKQPRGKARTPPFFWAAFQLSGDWR
jgi:CHAT domain-containing protein/Tfp pilus assembly protein PilF